MKNILLIIFLIVIIAACSTGTNSTEVEDSVAVESKFVEYSNPPAEGFNQQSSDLTATLIADKTMLAMGGREAWDNTRYISWNFFGRRDHLWDKWTGDVRIEVPEQELIVLMNINTKEGKAQKSGQPVTDSLDYYMQRGYEMWVNDSYWLVMPFKLKDSGVTLKYLGEDSTQAGARADVIGLSFEDVGVTPQNLYKVWVDTDSKLIRQWAYYTDSASTDPSFIMPWDDYKQYGEILLSGNRGRAQLSSIEVLSEVPEGMFKTF